MTANNPAGRLLDIFRKAQQQDSSQMTVRDIWAGVFQIPPEDSVRIYRKVISVHRLVEQLRTATTRLPFEPRLSERMFNYIDEFIKRDLRTA